MRQYPVWNQVYSCAYKQSNKGYGVNQYIEEEQPDTQYDLSKKIHSQHIESKNNIVVSFDANKLTPQNFQILVNLSDMLQDSGELGVMEYDIFKFNIKSLCVYLSPLSKVRML